MICLNNLCERKTKITQVVDSRIDSSNWNLYVSIDSNLVSQQGFVLENSGLIDKNGYKIYRNLDKTKTVRRHIHEEWNEHFKENSISCKNVWVVEVNKSIKTGKGKEEIIKDYKLSRYICYLIIQNADPSKEVVALGQTYFAIQTRKQEITEQEYDTLSDDEKRFYQRRLIKQGNYTLQKVAVLSGVKNMGEFHNAGYRGLYNGETADDIFKRKKLRYREDILDNMNEDELVANLFRINQTKQKLLRDNVTKEEEADNIHYEVGKKVRKAIADIGGVMPEDMLTPKKSLKELEKEKKKLKN